ncbi:MAG: response regulator [candidate division Zixibacteria bacterium]
MARILVVEDDSILNDFITRVLKKKDHLVTSSVDGLDALGKIHSDKFDLAIIDVVLPHVSGTRLLETLKKHYPKTMVIIISGQANLESAIDSLRHGAFEFFKKPLREKELTKVVDSALEEARLMKNSGYIYKDKRRKDRSLFRSGVYYALTDSVLTTLGFYLAFLVQYFVFEKINHPFLMDSAELAQMSVSLGFCYVFIFVFKRCHRVDLIGSDKELLGHLWRNITQTYLLFLAILFMGKQVHFAYDRMGVGIGYVLGFIVLAVNRFFIAPVILSRFSKEGKKNIVIVGSGDKAAGLSRQIRRGSIDGNIVGYINEDFILRKGPDPNSKVIASLEDMDRVVITDDVRELYIDGDALSSTEILTVLDKFKGRKLKIVILGGRSESFHLSDVASTVT